MDKFPLSLKEKYKERLINREKQWPPRHSNKLVRLQLVPWQSKKGEVCSAIMRRRKEDKTVKQTPLAYHDLFKGENEKHRVRKVLVEGDAGIGKTTLSISLSEDWANGELFQEFELLLLLSLRQKEVASAGSLRDLLKLFHSSPNVCESVASYLEEEEAKKVLVIADGWDELGESERKEGSFLYKLLFTMFPFISVVVTSRPSASAPLHSLSCIDRLVEVIGFSKDDVKEYIQSEFVRDQEKARRLLEQLQYNPMIESVCSVPLNCAIVCRLWHTLEEALPSTMTQLYSKLILYVVYRNLRKLEAYGPTFGMSSFDELPEGLQQSWWLLCQFACEALEKDKIVFSKKELLEFFPQGLAFDDKILCFGLLQSAETGLDVTCEVSFNFLHLTFMEYLAALYLSKQPLDRQLQFLQKKQYLPTIVSRFLFGICFSDSHNIITEDFDVQKILKCIAGTGIVTIHNMLPLCHCALEAQNNSVTNRVIQFSDSVPRYDNRVLLGFPHTAHDCAAILYVMNNMQKYTDLMLNFSNSGITDIQFRKLTDVLASRHGMLQVKSLNLSGNKLTDRCVSNLFSRATAAFLSLSDLDLSGNSIGAESIKSITTALAKSFSLFNEYRLTLFSMRDTPLELSGLLALQNAVHDGLFPQLEFLNLKGSLTSDTDTNAAFIEALSAHCPRLWLLDLTQNNLGVPGATALAKVISMIQHQSSSDGRLIFQQSKILSSILLSQTNLGDNGLSALIENLDGVCHIDSLKLNNNGISVTGISCLADALCSGKIVGDYISKLDLSDNPLGLEGTEAIGRILSSNLCQIEEVILTRCQLTRVGLALPNTDILNIVNNIGEAIRESDVGQQLCQMPHNDTISYLALDGISFTGESFHILVGLMHLCTSLIVLSSRDCKITSDDLKRLLDKLSQLKLSSPSLCSKLEAWWLNDNEIDDSGAEALLSHLQHKPSLFPRFGALDHVDDDIDFSNNPVSGEMEKMVKKEIRRHITPFLELFCRDHSKGEDEPSSTPSPSIPLDLTQCADVLQESPDGNGAGGNASVGPDSEGKLATEDNTTVSPCPLQMLNQVLDFENARVSKHLGQIADSMYEWEGPVAEQLGLTPAEIAAVKTKHPGELRLQMRAALEKWKQKLGSSATYSNLIDVFECAGYQGYAEVVRNVCATGVMSINQPLCSVIPNTTGETSSAAVTDSVCVHHIMVDKGRSCDKSCDSCDSHNRIILSTPPTSPAPPQHDNKELVDASCGTKRLSSPLEPSAHKICISSSPEPHLKDLVMIEVVNWEGVGLQLGVRDYELQTIKLDYQYHDERKREMFRAWLRTCVNPNYHDLIKALEAVGERKAAQKLRDKIFNV